jgi:hypothetical protein
MNEEQEQSGGFLHILFIFLGLALIGLAVFNLFTKDVNVLENKEEVKPVETGSGTIVTTSNIAKVEFDNNGTKAMKVDGYNCAFVIKKTANDIEFYMNDKLITIDNADGYINVYILLDKYILVEKKFHYLFLDVSGNITREYNTMNNGVYIASFGNDLFYGTRHINDKFMIEPGKYVDVCDLTALEEAKINGEEKVEASYVLKHYTGRDFKLELVAGSEKTLVELQSEICN